MTEQLQKKALTRAQGWTFVGVFYSEKEVLLDLKKLVSIVL